MATDYDFEVDFVPTISEKDYPDKISAFIYAMEAYATEIENAREGETDLVTNLANYLKYVLSNNISGGTTDGTDGYKCTNMKPADPNNPQEYITYGQALSLSGTGVTDITDLSPGFLNSNDIVVINTAGTGVVGRPTKYSIKTENPMFAQYNEMIDMNLTTSRVCNLPTGSPGSIIGFADVGGNVTDTTTLTINPISGNRIMGQAIGEPLVVSDYKYINFKLVYLNTTMGWVIVELQR